MGIIATIMAERIRTRRVIPDRHIDPQVALDSNGYPIYASRFSALFASRPPDVQVKLAFGCFRNYDITANHVFSWITDEGAKDQVRVWCKGKGIKLEEDQDPQAQLQKTKKTFEQDSELIDALSPYLSQIHLARILTIKRYREMDEKDQQILVSGNYRLLGEYLGPRRYYRQEPQAARLLPLPELAAEIFSDNLISGILFESEREAAMSIFNQDVKEGFAYLEELIATVNHPLKTDFIQRLITHFTNVGALTLAGFKDKIAGSEKDVPEDQRNEPSTYPSFHQKEYAYRLLNKQIGKVDLLIGDTGTMKTGGAIYAMEALGAKTTFVVCPGSLRETWDREIQEKYQDHVDVLKIEGIADLERVLKADHQTKPRYVIVSYNLLSRIGNSIRGQSNIETLVNKLGIDSLIADEVHLAKEYSAACTRALTYISSRLEKDAPRIAMTATGIVNGVDDLDAPVRVLMPHIYPNPGDFTRAARNDPYLVSALLHGDQLMTRWTLESVLGKNTPKVEYLDEAVPLSSFHQEIYDHVYNDNTIEAQTKRGILRQTSLDPLLIRKHYHPDALRRRIADLQQVLDQSQNDRDREITKARIQALEERLEIVINLANPEQVLSELKLAHEQFIKWKIGQDNSAVFDEDFLVDFGYNKLALWCFFNLSGGVDDLVRQSGDRLLQQDWEGKKGLYSSKYKELKGKLDKLLAAGNTKIVIGSGFYQTFVSSGIEDIKDDDTLAFLSLYDYLRSWYGAETVLRIDGKVGIEPRKRELSKREEIRRSWRLNPDKKIMLTTMRACKLGIDLTIPKTTDNSQIEEVVMILLDNPDTDEARTQFIGRERRKGQHLPIKVITLKTTNREQPQALRYGFIDHGIWQAIEFKRLLSQMVLDGVPLTPEEEEFVNSRLSNVKIDLYPETPQMYLNKTFFPSVRGQGAKNILDYFNQEGFEGMTNADFFAAFYPQAEELGLASHNAKAVAEVIKRFSKGRRLRIGSVGAGSGVLQNVLGQPVVNIDLLSDILQVARGRARVDSHYIIGEASNIPAKDNAFGITDGSLYIHWTNNKPDHREGRYWSSERTRAFRELNRVTENLVTLTIPHSYLSPERFKLWKEVLEEYFGFRLSSVVPSGLVRAVDFRTEPISWMLNLEKVGDPKPGADIEVLSFDFDRVSAIIDASEVGRGNGSDRTAVARTYLPHREFEIVEPLTRQSHEISFTPPTTQIHELEESLLRERGTFTATDALNLGSEEYGLYRYLVRRVRRDFDMSSLEAEALSLGALNAWLTDGYQRHDIYKIWSELRIIAQEIYERRK